MSCNCNKKCKDCEKFEEMNEIIKKLEDDLHDKEVMIDLLIYLVKG